MQFSCISTAKHVAFNRDSRYFTRARARDEVHTNTHVFDLRLFLGTKDGFRGSPGALGVSERHRAPCVSGNINNPRNVTNVICNVDAPHARFNILQENEARFYKRLFRLGLLGYTFDIPYIFILPLLLSYSFRQSRESESNKIEKIYTNAESRVVAERASRAESSSRNTLRHPGVRFQRGIIAGENKY